jgi:hypothetical protein
MSLTNIAESVLKCILPVLIFFAFYDSIDRHESRLERKREIYNNFKNTTLSIIIKKWEKTHYDFSKLHKITSFLNNENDFRCWYTLTYIYIYNFLPVHFQFFSLMLLHFINEYPFWAGLIIFFSIELISNMVPLIDTEVLLKHSMLTIISNKILLVISNIKLY